MHEACASWIREMCCRLPNKNQGFKRTNSGNWGKKFFFDLLEHTVISHYLQADEAYYDDHLYEYAYEYADSTEAEYIEEKAEEALESVNNQINKKRRKRHNSKRQVPSDYADAESEENVKLLCCSFQKYLHCSETVVNTTCGYETAQFTKSFLDRMSGPLIQVIYFQNHDLIRVINSIKDRKILR